MKTIRFFLVSVLIAFSSVIYANSSIYCVNQECYHKGLIVYTNSFFSDFEQFLSCSKQVDMTITYNGHTYHIEGTYQKRRGTITWNLQITIDNSSVVTTTGTISKTILSGNEDDENAIYEDIESWEVSGLHDGDGIVFDDETLAYLLNYLNNN